MDWSGVRSDLTNFVQTIKTDVLGNGENKEGPSVTELKQKRLVDLRRSFDTFSSPIEQEFAREFNSYMKNFSLVSKKEEIQSVLDEEVDISRYYADLVPISLKPEHFWGRYFFRVHLVENDGELGFDEVVEEEGNWDDAPTAEDGIGKRDEAENQGG